tara:strand:+ start:93 stop:1091 length:999 start_codon:yes stop_codon:yes gene_type:complete
MKTKDTNFKDFIMLLNNNRVFIRKTIILFLAIAVIYSFISTVYYESKITLYPAGELSDSTEIFSDFSDLIESLGINDLSPENNFYIPDIIESSSLRKEIINKKWITNKFPNPVNLITYWELDQKSFFSNLLLSFKNYFNAFEDNNILLLENEAIEILDDLIYVDEQNSGLIEVKVLMEEPKLAVDVVDFISEYVISYVTNEQRKFASKTREYLENRLLLAKEDLYNSENELTNFRTKYPLNLDTPNLQLQRLRLIRSVDVNQEVFITIRKQYELAKIEESKERLFINILDSGKENIYKEYPKRFIIIITYLFLGFLVSILCLLLNQRFKEYF